MNVIPTSFSHSHIRFFRHAAQISNLSDCQQRIGAILVIGNKIYATGFNRDDKTCRIQHKYSHLRSFDPTLSKAPIHAEISLLNQIKNLGLNLKKAKVYVFRKDRNGFIADSRPCPACYAAMRDFGIRTVYFTSRKNGFEVLKIV